MSLVIELTIVAFGTNSPEMAVSAQSALAGQADIALSNTVIQLGFIVIGLGMLIESRNPYDVLCRST